MGIIKFVVPFTCLFLCSALARGTRRGFRLLSFMFLLVFQDGLFNSSFALCLNSLQVIISILHFTSSNY